MTAIVMPGGRYRYEGRFFGGAAVLISDGVRQWDYLPERNVYTQVPVLSEEAEKKHVHQQDELAAVRCVGAHQETRFFGRAPNWIRGRRVRPRCLTRLYSSTHSLG